MAEWANRISDVERQSYDNMTLFGLLKLKVYRRATGEAIILVLVTSRHAELCTVCLTHKVLRSGEPEALASVLQVNGDLRQRNTRQDSLLCVPRSRTEAGKRRFCSRAPRLYNSIPAGLAELGPRSFSRALKRELLAAEAE